MRRKQNGVSCLFEEIKSGDMRITYIFHRSVIQLKTGKFLQSCCPTFSIRERRLVGTTCFEKHQQCIMTGSFESPALKASTRKRVAFTWVVEKECDHV